MDRYCRFPRTIKETGLKGGSDGASSVRFGVSQHKKVSSFRQPRGSFEAIEPFTTVSKGNLIPLSARTNRTLERFAKGMDFVASCGHERLLEGF
jgi:hypothetical protein